MTDESAIPSRARWTQAWPDALAFVAGLALARFNDWQTKDLVWSLWLSSLMVGYAMILWAIFGTRVPARTVNFGSLPEDAQMLRGGLVLAGRLFLLGFFTVHFGLFHFVHAAFLNKFFPVLPGEEGFLNAQLFFQVLKDYWPFVLVAVVAERQAFSRPKVALTSGVGMMAPYKNVVRLHLLIFFFAFMSYAHLHNFAIYAVVYAVYFFPWRLVFPPKPVPRAE